MAAAALKTMLAAQRVAQHAYRRCLLAYPTTGLAPRQRGVAALCDFALPSRSLHTSRAWSDRPSLLGTLFNEFSRDGVHVDHATMKTVGGECHGRQLVPPG